MTSPSVKYPLPVKISGLGSYLPARTVANRELEERYKLSPGWIERKQGVKQRHWVNGETITFMGAEAAKAAVRDAGLQLSDIDLIVSATQAFERAIPDQAALFQRELGLGDSGVPCMTITSACLSFLVALDVCSTMLATGRYGNILVIMAESPSLSMQMDDHKVATLMGDGASAAVLTKTEEGGTGALRCVLMKTYSEASEVSSAVRNGNHFQTFFHREVKPEDFMFSYDPASLQATAMKHNRNFLKELWPNSDFSGFKCVIPNQSSRFGLDMMKLMFPADKIVGVVDRFGNCGAVGYPLALYEAVNEGRLQRGDLVLLTGMGAGFSIIGVILTY